MRFSASLVGVKPRYLPRDRKNSSPLRAAVLVLDLSLFSARGESPSLLIYTLMLYYKAAVRPDRRPHHAVSDIWEGRF